MKLCGIGILGIKLDQRGYGAARWEKWRPTMSLFQHEDLLFDCYELIYQPGNEKLAELTKEDIEKVSPITKVTLHPIDIADPWDFEEMYGVFHDFAKSYSFDLENYKYLLHITTGTHVAQICFFLLTEAKYFPAKLIQSSPSRHANGTYRIIDLDLSKYDQLVSRFHKEHLEGTDFLKSGIATLNQAFNEQIAQIEQIAIKSKAPILLMGPTGAGKSKLAKRIYELKLNRRQIEGQFIEVNCATLRGDTAMSTLFGHVKGAFTGAGNERDGLLKSADKGILFLDEIGDLGLDEQAILLRAIEEKCFLPMGSDKPIYSNFLLIAGTNRNLSNDAVEGKFRDDLLARINLWTYTLPGLKDRTEDIPPNIDYELEHYTKENGMVITFNKAAKKLFIEFAQSPQAIWKANFRDLNASITRMATLTSGARISEDIVTEEIHRLIHLWQPTRDSTNQLDPLLQQQNSLDHFDLLQLNLILKECRKHISISSAGRALFNISRAKKDTVNDSDRLSKYLKKFDICWNDIHPKND